MPLVKERKREGGKEKEENNSPCFEDAAIAKLGKEINSWNAFAEVLRIEDRNLFKEMLRRCWSYSDSAEMMSGDDEYATEALLISLLVSQQKEINSLSKRLDVLKSTA